MIQLLLGTILQDLRTKQPVLYFLSVCSLILDVNVTEIVQDSLKVAITYQLTNPDKEKHRLRDEL